MEKAIAQLNNSNLDGRVITVREVSKNYLVLKRDISRIFKSKERIFSLKYNPFEPK